MNGREEHWLLERARKLYDDRYRRIGKCKVCGDPILWWNTRHRTRVPLDPVPLLDIGQLINNPSAQLYIPNGRTSATRINRAETGEILLYRVHRDGECLRHLERRAAGAGDDGDVELHRG